MGDPHRRVERAIGMVPARNRARYAEEWRGDLASAASLGRSEREVARAATRLAVTLRLRWVAMTLLGEAGAKRALSAWGVLLSLLGATCAFGGPALLALLATTLVLSVAFLCGGAPSHWSHWLAVAALVSGVGSAGYVWWSFGAGVDAADAAKPVPAAANWTGLGLLVFLASGVLLVVAALMAVGRQRKIHRTPADDHGRDVRSSR